MTKRITSKYLLPLIAVTLLLSSCEMQNTIVKTNEQNNFFTTPTPDTTRPKFNLEACRKQASISFLVDKTQSGADAMLVKESNKLAEILYALCPKTATVGNFGSDGQGVWSASEKADNFPALPVAAAFDEDAVNAELKTLCSARLKCMEAELKEGKKKHAKAQREAEQNFEKEFAAAVNSVIAEIVALGQHEPACSDMTDLQDRVKNTDSDYIVAITDGQHTCRSELRVAEFDSSKKVIVLVMPLAKESESGAFTARRTRLAATFSGATVLAFPSTKSATII